MKTNNLNYPTSINEMNDDDSTKFILSVKLDFNVKCLVDKLHFISHFCKNNEDIDRLLDLVDDLITKTNEYYEKDCKKDTVRVD